jgi:signal transduction histidine kinase
LCTIRFSLFDQAGLTATFTASSARPMYPLISSRKADSQQILELFEYNCSHILCAPLKTIEGLLDLLEAETNEKQIPVYFDMILKCATNLEILVEELRQTIAGMDTLVAIAPIDFHELLRAVVTDFDLLLRLKSIKLSITIEQGEPFYSDSHRLAIILKQLICNSIMFSDPSKITRTIEIDVKTAVENCTITVHDNGCGIDYPMLQRIFQPFFRGSERSTGSGLGLFIVLETSKKISGTVFVKSTVKQDSTFTLRLRNLSGK